MSRKRQSNNKSASNGAAGSTFDQLAAMSDEQLAAEQARMLAVVSEAEKKLAALPRPLPPEMRGYRNPAFHLYLDRKYLWRITGEVLAREKERQSSTEE